MSERRENTTPTVSPSPRWGEGGSFRKGGMSRVRGAAELPDPSPPTPLPSGERGESWQTPALGSPHSWSYRGQVLPTDREVTVILEVTAADDSARRLTANGFLTVDSRVIYQMTDFTLDYPQ